MYTYIYIYIYPRRAHYGLAHEGPGVPTRAQGGPQGPGPQGPREAQQGLAHKGPSDVIYHIYIYIHIWCHLFYFFVQNHTPEQ